MRLHRILTTAVSFVALPTALAAQDAGDVASGDELQTDDEIVVIGGSLRGQVDTLQAPIVELDEQDIAAYGVSSIAELVEALAPETSSARGRGDSGRPVFLINGIRVGSFREFRSYPPEAIRKVEVLPEETAQQFGFPPNQRVINFILKDNFSAVTVDLEYEQPDRGGYSRNEQELTVLKISGSSRLNFNIDVEDTSLLTESERNIIQTDSSIPGVATDPDPAAFRSLIADSREIEATANWTSRLGESSTVLALNGTYNRSDSRSLSGLNSVTLTDPDSGASVLRTFGADDALERRNSTDTLSFSSSLNTMLNSWDTSFTIDAIRAESETEIDSRVDTADLVAAVAAGTLGFTDAIPAQADAGFDISRSQATSVVSKATFQGYPISLPAGDLSTTFDLGYDWRRISSQDTRITDDTELTRKRIRAGTALTIPIAERGAAWGAIGDLSINLSAGVEDLSDFGTLGEYTAGLTWGASEKLTLSATYIYSEAAPTLTQLGAAQVVSLNESVFDFTTGETVLVDITSGGNADLVEEQQRDWKFSANWEVPFVENARLQVDYVRNRSDNVSTSFPLLTSEIEAAFPDRVTRDGDGVLTAIDQRPITFAETANDRLSVGLSMRGSFGKANVTEGAGGRGGNGAGRGGGGRGGEAGRGRGGRGGGVAARAFGGGDGRGRFFLSLNHTVELKNEVLVADGGLLLDLLDGDALSANGSPRHSTTLQGGMFRNGWGLRASGRYTGSTRVDGTGAPDSTDLFFNDLATLDLRIFADMGQIFDKQDGFLKGFRVSLLANNVFDGQRRVTNSDGEVPLSYQPNLIDPTGRYLGIDLRKLF